MQFSTLDLDWRIREGGDGKDRVQYLDFTIDGQSLLDCLPPLDKVGVLGWGPPEAERNAISQLLLREPSALLGGRVPLYVCPQCGHLDCGSISVHVENHADSFVWSGFAWEVTYEIAQGDAGVLYRYEEVGPLAFPSEEYVNVFSGRLRQLAV